MRWLCLMLMMVAPLPFPNPGPKIHPEEKVARGAEAEQLCGSRAVWGGRRADPPPIVPVSLAQCRALDAPRGAACPCLAWGWCTKGTLACRL